MTCGQAMALYGEHHAMTVAAPERIGYAIAALDGFWGDMRVSAINGPTCRRYATVRKVAPATGPQVIDFMVHPVGFEPTTSAFGGLFHKRRSAKERLAFPF